MGAGFRYLRTEEEGILCGCNLPECLCDDTADFFLGDRPYCGCCAGDCPDVHPLAAEELMRRFHETEEMEEQIRGMVAEGSPPLPSGAERLRPRFLI